MTYDPCCESGGHENSPDDMILFIPTSHEDTASVQKCLDSWTQVSLPRYL